MSNKVIVPGQAGSAQGSLPAAKQGSEGVQVMLAFVQRDGSTALDVTGATITGSYRRTTEPPPDEVYSIDGTLAVADGPSGQVTWTWGSGDVGEAGTFEVEFKVVVGGITYKSDWIKWEVTEALDATAVAAGAIVGVSAAEASWLTQAAAAGILPAPGLGDYENIVLVDAGGSGDYTALSSALDDSSNWNPSPSATDRYLIIQVSDTDEDNEDIVPASHIDIFVFPGRVTKNTWLIKNSSLTDATISNLSIEKTLDVSSHPIAELDGADRTAVFRNLTLISDLDEEGVLECQAGASFFVDGLKIRAPNTTWRIGVELDADDAEIRNIDWRLGALSISPVGAMKVRSGIIVTENTNYVLRTIGLGGPTNTSFDNVEFIQNGNGSVLLAGTPAGASFELTRCILDPAGGGAAVDEGTDVPIYNSILKGGLASGATLAAASATHGTCIQV